MRSPSRFASALEVVTNIRSGSACAILVEGEERGGDAWILSYILKERVGEEVVFYGRDGRANLLAELPDFIRQVPDGQLAAVLDRDFIEAATIAQTRAPDYAGHLYYWRWSCIENYLLEPAWVVEAVDEFYMHQPERLPTAFQSTEGVESFLLESAQRLTSQVAGNWVISDLTREAASQGMSITARTYFREQIQRDPTWVLARLSEHYGGWSEIIPDLFNPKALRARYDRRLADVSAQVNTLSNTHEIISGKLLLTALYSEMPGGPKPPKEYLRNRLVRMASKQTPEDVRALIEEHILPRWRRARVR